MGATDLVHADGIATVGGALVPVQGLAMALRNGQAGGMHIGHVEHALAVASLGQGQVAVIGFVIFAHLVDRIGFQHLDHLPGDTTLLVGSRGCAATEGKRQGHGVLAAAG